MFSLFFFLTESTKNVYQLSSLKFPLSSNVEHKPNKKLKTSKNYFSHNKIRVKLKGNRFDEKISF
jgi:hypothetical protein